MLLYTKLDTRFLQNAGISSGPNLPTKATTQCKQNFKKLKKIDDTEGMRLREDKLVAAMAKAPPGKD